MPSSNALTPEQKQEIEDQRIWRAVKDALTADRKALVKKRAALNIWVDTSDENLTTEEKIAAEIRRCASDFFYWCEWYVWTFDPREDPQVIPFKLFDYQAEDAQWVLDAINSTIGTLDKRDLLIEKSRGIGWSWLIITIAVWFLIFHNKSSLIGSRKEEEADKLNDIDTLLEKARFIIRRLPEWQLPDGMNLESGSKGHMGHKLIQNPKGGQIAAEASCANFGRGGRKLFVVFDEFASWAYDEASSQAAGGSTNCRIFISTPNGPFNQFAMMARHEQENYDIKPEVRRRHWSEHPECGAALRKDKNNKPTSPWYRVEKKRYTPDGVAAELDINYIASQRGLVFPDYIPEWHRVKDLTADANKPIVRVWDPGNTFFVLWMQVDSHGRVLCLEELCVTDDEEHPGGATIREVANEVIRISQERFPGFEFEDYGDPAGGIKQGASAALPEWVVLHTEYGIYVDTSAFDTMPSRLRVKTRIMAIHNQLGKTCRALRTHSLLVDQQRCKHLDRALLEGYRYKVDKATKRVMEIVDEEHPYEDAVDCLGMGIVSKLGLAMKDQAVGEKKHITVKKNQVRWRGNRRRGGY